MIYYKEFTTKDHRKIIVRNASGTDAEAYIEYFDIAHSETDYLTSYPEENEHDVKGMSEYLEELKNSPSEVELCAFDGETLLGSAGFCMVKNREKTRHRADFGISIIKRYWNLGIGTELTKACVELAREVGYRQLELEVVSENQSAVGVYQKQGFVEFGRNPKAFHTRQGQWQEVLLMRLEL